jgi:hypothetical protein
VYFVKELLRQHDEELELELEGNANCIFCTCWHEELKLQLRSVFPAGVGALA